VAKPSGDDIPLGCFVYQRRECLGIAQTYTYGPVQVPIMSVQIVRASISLVAMATVGGTLFLASWIGLALLGF
jgi:hypothetical protein